MLFRKAILIIHGFAGGTYDQEYLANYLELEPHFDVFTFTLPGHDTALKNKITKELWIKSSEQHIEMLIRNGYKKIYVIGHSMGGVIACHLVTKYKEIKKLVLAAPAFEYLALKDGEFNLLEGIKHSPELIKTYSKEEFMFRVIKLPFKTINEFTSLVKKYKNTPKSIQIPTFIVHGMNDLVVPVESSKTIYNLIPTNNKKLLLFDKTTHDLFRGPTKEKISKEVRDFLRK